MGRGTRRWALALGAVLLGSFSSAVRLRPSARRRLDPGVPAEGRRGRVLPPRPTALGVPVRRGVVAVDPKLIPLGTKLQVPGYGPGLAADVGYRHQGPDHRPLVPHDRQGPEVGPAHRHDHRLPLTGTPAVGGVRYTLIRDAGLGSTRRGVRRRRSPGGVDDVERSCSRARPRARPRARQRRESPRAQTAAIAVDLQLRRDGLRQNAAPRAGARIARRSSRSRSPRSTYWGRRFRFRTEVVGRRVPVGRDVERRPLPRRLRRPDARRLRPRPARQEVRGRRDHPHRRPRVRRRARTSTRGGTPPAGSPGTSVSSLGRSPRCPSRAFI